MAAIAAASGPIAGAPAISSVSTGSGQINANLGTYTDVSYAGIDANSAFGAATFAALSANSAKAARAVSAHSGAAYGRIF
jgi:hypothetical protein